MIYDQTVFTNKYKISIKNTPSISIVSHFDLVGNDSPVVEDVPVFSYRYALFRSKILLQYDKCSGTGQRPYY